jgi:methionyl-tRNA formyltransferase
LKTIFAGTPGFAVRCLEALLDSHHRVVSVLTQPDRPAGRGLVPIASPVKRLAELRGITVTTPESLRDTGFQQQLSLDQPDIMVVAAYGLILPRAVLDIPKRGAINVHASLLPRWRGAAPIQRALLAGDSKTGISIMQMDEGLDTGQVLLQESVPIHANDTAGTLHDRLAELGAKLAVQVLDTLEADGLKPTPQSALGVTYAPKFEKQEARIDWREPAIAVSRRVRASNPSPGAVARLRGVDVKIWRCTAVSDQGNPGEVLRADAAGILVACGQGAILADELQRPGGKRLAAAEFLRGFQLVRGERFDV